MTNYRHAIFAGLSAWCALTLPASANTFDEAAPHLDLDGTFVAMMDFEGDGQELGLQLNTIYQQVLASQPDMMPIPIDFPALFETLGFGTVDAWAFSSKELGDGLHRNRSVMLMGAEPKGLVDLYDLEPTTFRAADLAPADATTVITATIKFTTLRDTIKALAVQIMGPMGQGMIEQNVLLQPVPGTEVTVNEVIEELSGPMDLVMKQGMKPDGQPDFQIWASIQEAGDVLARLRSLEEAMPITFTEDESGLVADCSALFEGGPMGLFFEAPAGQDVLFIYTDASWAEAIKDAPERLITQPEFVRLMAQLPPQAASYAYSAGFDPEEIYALFENEPQVQQYMPLIRSVVDALLGDFLAPYANAAYQKGDVIISDQYAHYSLKQAVMMVPAALGAGVGAAAAIPAFQNIQKTSQEKTVQNNLRQIASAAQQKMLDEGVAEVSFADVVGPGNYIPEIESVAGETYDQIVITTSTTEISVELPDGRLVTYEF